jgi:hypothetical protein
VISVETSTPKARAFIEESLDSPALSKVGSTLTSRELRAVISDSPPADLTNPMSEPFPDVIQDLSQLSTLTASYLGRAMAGAILLATGVLRNDPIAIVVAALFLPFLSQVLAISFGVWSGDWKLARQGTVAVMASTIAAVLGRRYLIGVAGAVQFAVFPVWLGLALVSGLPGQQVITERLLSFAINLVTLSATAAFAYAAIHFKNGWKAPRRGRVSL